MRFHRGTFPCLILIASLPALLPACSGTRVLSNGSVCWHEFSQGENSFNAALALPAGHWEVEVVEAGHVVSFRQVDGPADIALVRVPSRRSETADVAMTRLFAEFKEKRVLARETYTLPGGIEARFGEYEVTVDDHVLRVHAAVVRRGQWTYDLVAWGLMSEVFARLARSLSFEPPDRTGQGPVSGEPE